MSKPSAERLQEPADKGPDTCGTCRFFNLRGRSLCRRYPPASGAVASPPQGSAAFYPVVDPGDWCGEFQAIVGSDVVAPAGEHGKHLGRGVHG